jgi:hypothetical protein
MASSFDSWRNLLYDIPGEEAAEEKGFNQLYFLMNETFFHVYSTSKRSPDVGAPAGSSCHSGGAEKLDSGKNIKT